MYSVYNKLIPIIDSHWNFYEVDAFLSNSALSARIQWL